MKTRHFPLTHFGFGFVKRAGYTCGPLDASPLVDNQAAGFWVRAFKRSADAGEEIAGGEDGDARTRYLGQNGLDIAASYGKINRK